MGAIVGGVIGGLLFLGAIGVGAWVFLRKRAIAPGNKTYGGIDGDDPDYPRYSDGPIMAEHDVEPSQLRLYVSLSSSRLTCILTDVERTRPIHPPTPARVIMKRVGDKRTHLGVITVVLRNCEQLGKVSSLSTLNTHFPDLHFTFLFCFLLPHATWTGMDVILFIVTPSCGFGHV